MLPPGGLTAKDLVQKHAGEWRTTLIEEERVRMDGCYIAVCHYMCVDPFVRVFEILTVFS